MIVGDGPYRAELEQLLEGLPVTFTGFLERMELSRAYASADVKLFPSTTDTWGNAPAEGQASGLPVIVSSIGGPAELMLDGVTGFQVSGHDTEELLEVMKRLLQPEIRTALGMNARAFAEERRVDEPFTAILDADAYRRHQRDEKLRGEKVRDEKVRDELAASGRALASLYFVTGSSELESVA
jgi:glycosyltransferase involved in cell wall biosynthesis